MLYWQKQKKCLATASNDCPVPLQACFICFYFRGATFDCTYRWIIKILSLYYFNIYPANTFCITVHGLDFETWV